MPCPGKQCPFDSSELVDYHGQHRHTPTRIYRPRTKGELVWAIQDCEQNGWSARAIGSDMSLSRAGYTDEAAIATDALNRHVLPPLGASAKGLDPKRLRSKGGAKALASCLAPAVHSRGKPNLVFVEGGTKIRELLADLSKLTPALAVPAMGAGGRQSIVGALATGTHGSEIDRQPLVDAIRAVYLVGPGGQEWWLERSNGWSDEAHLRKLVPGLCHDAEVRYDDVLFYSALVGVGRLGVIYAVVLEVEPDYFLEEERTPNGEPWAPVEADLVASIGSGYMSAGGIFTKRNVTFLQIALNPNDLTTCWTVQRRRIAPTAKVGLTKDPVDPIALFCQPSAPAWAAIGPTIDLLVRPVLSALPPALLVVDAVFPGVGAAAAVVGEVEINKALSWIRDAFLLSHNLGEAAATILQAYPMLLTPITNALIDMAHQTSLKRAQSFEVLDQVDYSQPLGCFSGVGSEYHFNARAPEYLSFVSSVAMLAHDLGGIPGYISLRFVPQTDAYLGMERFPLTVAIELSCVTPWPTADPYLRGAQALAIAAGGIPHWGQKLYEPVDAAALYGSALAAYHLAVATVEVGHGATFTSPFSAAQGLDPPAGPLPAVAAAARPSVSVKALVAAGASLVPSGPKPASVKAVADLYMPSLRMNPRRATLPVGLASRADRGASVRDLARRLI